MSGSAFRPGWIAQIFFYFGAFAVYTGYRSDALWLGVAVALPVLLIGGWLAGRDEHDAVKSANEVASSALERALSRARRGEQLAVTLYLRPFRITGQLPLDNPRAGALMTPESFAEPRELDLETMIASELSDSLPLVALGEPGEHVGAGRVATSEDDWQDAVKSLAGAAHRILVVPSAQPGTLWELGWLLDNAVLGKTVFLMPPAPRDGADVEADWASATEAARQLGIELPPYDDEGCLFTLDGAGQLLHSASIELYRKDTFERAIANLEEQRRAARNQDEDVATGDDDRREPPLDLPPPQVRKTPSVPYVLIGGLFIVALIWLGQGDRRADPDELETEPISSPRCKPVAVGLGVGAYVPSSWNVRDQPKLAVARSSSGSLQCSFAVEQHDAAVAAARFDELSEAGVAQELREQAAQQGMILSIETRSFERVQEGDVQSIRYALELETVVVGRNSEQLAFGRYALNDRLLVHAQCGLGSNADPSRARLVERILASIEFAPNSGSAVAVPEPAWCGAQ